MPNQNTRQQNNQRTSFLDKPVLSRLRRNHGLEHATLHVLARKNPGKMFAGHSNPGGFYILGEIETSKLQSAVDEALLRLKNGEASLAVHPNCGTNLVVSGVSAGAAVLLAMSGTGARTSKQIQRLPMAAAAAAAALIVSKPLGLYLQQRVTTSGDPGGLEIVEIKPVRMGTLKTHRVTTRG
jgi:hypothetical protein